MAGRLAASTVTMAKTKPFTPAHATRVRTLYRKVLKHQLSWTVMREIWFDEAAKTRARSVLSTIESGGGVSGWVVGGGWST